MLQISEIVKKTEEMFDLFNKHFYNMELTKKGLCQCRIFVFPPLPFLIKQFLYGCPLPIMTAGRLIIPHLPQLHHFLD